MDGKKSISETNLGSLSKTILDYYNKYGQNRDLEKYLLIRKCQKTCTSTNSSQEFNEKSQSKLTQSLETLNTSIHKTLPRNSQSAEAIKTDKSDSKNNSSSKEKSPINVTTENKKNNGKSTKMQLKNEQKLKKKSFNLNMDTSITINVPAIATTTAAATVNPISDMNAKIYDYKSSQTEIGDIPQLSIQNLPETKLDLKQDTTTPRSPSPASSQASISNKHRLEWDSMADVGYEKTDQNIAGKSNEMIELTSLEKSGLKRFFSDRGINVDDNFVIIATNKQNVSNEIDIMSKDNKLNNKKDSCKEQTKEPKLLWKTALAKYREKYLDETLYDGIEISSPIMHSTPNDNPKLTLNKDPNENIREKCQKDKEKSCQTSFVQMVSKEIQVNEVSEKESLYKSNTSDSNHTLQESARTIDDNCPASVSSFEFLPPIAYEKITHRKSIVTGAILPARILSAPARTPTHNLSNTNSNKENINPYECGVGSLSIDKLDGSTSVQKNQSSSSEFDEQSLDTDILDGINHLNSLLESKAINTKIKKRLLRKIILGLLKDKADSLSKTTTNTSNEILLTSINRLILTTTSENNTSDNIHQSGNTPISGIKPITSNSSTNQGKSNDQKENIAPDQQLTFDDTMIDWLQPMTYSEMDFKHHQLLQGNTIDNQQQQMQANLINAQEKYLNKPKNISSQKNNVEHPVQIEYIEKEIARLLTLKIELENKGLKKKPIEKTEDKWKKIPSETIPLEKHPKTYQNITQKCINHKKTNDTMGKSTSTSSANNSGIKLHIDNSTKNTTSSSSPNSSQQPSWLSHAKMLQILKNRSKLRTPSSLKHITDVSAYIQAKKYDFIRSYEKTRSKLYNTDASSSSQLYHEPHQSIYHQPYTSTIHYSEPHSSHHHHRLRHRNIKTTIKNDPLICNQNVCSDAYLSSRSVSIPEEVNTTSNTTTHQYDTHTSIAVQTTDSVCRTTPIFGDTIQRNERCLNCLWTCSCHHPQTVRVRKLNKDKILQVTPESIAYTLTFSDNKSREKDQTTKISLHPIAQKITDQVANNSISTKISTENNQPFNDDRKTLQQQLQENRPHFISRADDRRQCLNEIHNLRLKQNEQRNKLLLLSTDTSLKNYLSTNKSSLSSQLNHTKRPRSTLATSKIFRAQTKQRYNKLPEIRRKKEMEKQRKLRTNQRIVTDIFKKNLQKQVLNGNLNISNSINLVPI